MNLSLILLVIAQLESSGGRNFKHPQPENHGWYGMSDLAIMDINRHYGLHYTADDTLNRNIASTMASLFIRMYMREDWTARECLGFWRCGIGGMNHMTEVQQKYVDHGMRMYAALLRGENKWQETL